MQMSNYGIEAMSATLRERVVFASVVNSGQQEWVISEMEEATNDDGVRQSQPHCENVMYFASAVETQGAVMGDVGNVRCNITQT